MPNDDEPAARFKTLAQSKKTESTLSNRVLQERLNALYAGVVHGEGTEQDFTSRLASLVSDGTERQPPSANDLRSRLSRLSTRNDDDAGTGSATRVNKPGQAYDVPEDFCEEWQDLDDLLEAALDGQGGDEIGIDKPDVEKKLRDLEALLETPPESTVARADKAGGVADKAVEAFLGAAGGAGKGASRDEQLGDEEERLLQMVADQVRLEGDGFTDEVFNPSKEHPGGAWLPLAPSGHTQVFPTSIGGRGKNTGGADAEAGADLIAQQAMEEARLESGHSRNSAEGARSSRKGAEWQQQQQQRQQQQQQDEQASSSWCCVCSEDATLRCPPCEAENGQDGPELFCARCFNEIHRDDDEMKTHRSRPLSSGVADGEKKGLQGWRRRK